MDINDFYRQARQWKVDKEHQDREDAAKRQHELEQAWRGAKEAIRQAFPITGAKLYQTEPGQLAAFPFSGGNYQFDLALPGVEFTPGCDVERMTGVIRVVVNCVVPYTFKVIHHYVWVGGSCQGFESPYEAFLAACGEIGYPACDVKA